MVMNYNVYLFFLPFVANLVILALKILQLFFNALDICPLRCEEYGSGQKEEIGYGFDHFIRLLFRNNGFFLKTFEYEFYICL